MDFYIIDKQVDWIANKLLSPLYFKSINRDHVTPA